MKPEFVKLLVCPACEVPLSLASQPVWRGAAIGSGALRCHRCGRDYPITDGIPRFTASDAYASSFSFEWKRFATTQLDSARGWSDSEQRFQQSLGFPLEKLDGLQILDAGCGMGRFAEVAAKHGGNVVAADLSYAVEVAARNLARWPDTVHCVQADLAALPFAESRFDLIYSLGVLHHTPDPKALFLGLTRLLKPGGKISITLYSGYNELYIASTTLWRRLTTRLPPRLVYYLAHWAIPAYYLYRVPLIGHLGRLVFPISHHRDPEWRVLDTLDCYTPRYQSFHTHPEVFRWYAEAGLGEITVLEPGISFIGTRR